MNTKIKRIIEDLTPPLVLRGAKSLFKAQQISEKGADYYDHSFEERENLSKHYTESGYYFLWAVMADRIMRDQVNSLLDIGCGSGQLATFLRDKGLKSYYGVDFSPKRIEYAKKICPEFQFIVEDAFQTNLFETYNYDAIVSTEFLEHVIGDIEIIKHFKSGSKFYGTVPNFPHKSHVRHFNSENEVCARYNKYFTKFSVTSFLANTRGTTYYLMQGIKS